MQGLSSLSEEFRLITGFTTALNTGTKRNDAMERESIPNTSHPQRIFCQRAAKETTSGRIGDSSSMVFPAHSGNGR